MRGLTQTWWSRWDCFRLREENPRKPLNIRNHCHLLILASSLGDLRRPLGHADNARMWQQLATVDLTCGFTSPCNSRPVPSAALRWCVKQYTYGINGGARQEEFPCAS